jgi:hypothetical protein
MHEAGRLLPNPCQLLLSLNLKSIVVDSQIPGQNSFIDFPFEKLQSF